MSYTIPYDTSIFISASIGKVVETLLEAMLLVFLVMFLFLQNIRYTIIPTIVVPVALLGTFGALLAMGFSINVLTMFGMVLVVGIVVDDAIVVVENVERIMSEEGLPPLQATRKAMGQISGAIIGITVVLISVFVPLAFFAGSTGNIYRQFSATMATSIAFSAFLALSLTPALCATLLKPVEAGHHLEKGGFFGWFNRGFKSTAKNYEGGLAKLLKRAGRMMIVYVMLIGVVGLIYMRLPTSFLPNEDQGYIVTNVQLPAGATLERTRSVLTQVEGYMLKQPEIANIVTVAGFSFSGQGQNAGLAFVILKDWSERAGPEHSAQAVAGRAFGALMAVRDAFIFALSPPPIPELGNATGFTFRLQDRGSKGHVALLNARNSCWAWRAKAKSSLACDLTAWKTRPRCKLTSTATRPVRWAWGLTASTALCQQHSVRPMSTTSRTKVGCNAWSFRSMPAHGCNPKKYWTCPCSTAAIRSCRSRLSPARTGSTARCKPFATTAIQP